jgi:single-strand DNA-binding protein
MSVNKVILVGNLGRDAELRYTPGGAAVSTLNLATTEKWNDRNGNRQEKTERHRIVLWGKSAENLQEYLVKGKQIYVEGRLQTRQWEDKEGVKRYTTEIKADKVTLLGGGGRNGQPAGDYDPSAAYDQPGGVDSSVQPIDGGPITEDDIPF